MIFAFNGHVDQVVSGIKTQTRRNSDKYKLGKDYAVQSGRGKPADPRGRIKITKIWVELGGTMISEADAKAEGCHQLGHYTPYEYELLYHKMNKLWEKRHCYEFKFLPTVDSASLRSKE